MAQKIKIVQFNLKDNKRVKEKLNGRPLPAQLYNIPVHKSTRRTTVMRILSDGSAKIMCSMYVPQQAIEDFVLNNLEWLLSKSKLNYDKHEKSKVDFSDGAIIYFLGYAYKLHVFESNDNRVLWKAPTVLSRVEMESLTSLNIPSISLQARHFNMPSNDAIEGYLFNAKVDNLLDRYLAKTYTNAPLGELVVITKDKSNNNIRKIILSEYKKTIEKAIDLLSKTYEDKLQVQVNKYIVKSYKARFGQCDGLKKHIFINVFMAMKPLACIELILAHEISHLIEGNHSKSFKQTLERVISYSKEREKLLKAHQTPNYLD